MSTIRHTKCTSSLETFSITLISLSSTYNIVLIWQLTFVAMRNEHQGTVEELKDWSSKYDMMLHFWSHLSLCFLYIFNFGLSLYTFLYDSRCGHSIATSLAKILSVRSHLLAQHSIVKMFHYGLTCKHWLSSIMIIASLSHITSHRSWQQTLVNHIWVTKTLPLLHQSRTLLMHVFLL